MAKAARTLPLEEEAPFTGESPDIDGLGGSKLICGIRVHGTMFRTRKDDKFIWGHMIVRRQLLARMILLP